MIVEKEQKIVGQKIGKSENYCNFDNNLQTDKNMNKVPEINEKLLTENPYKTSLAIPVRKVISNIEFAENTEGVLVNKVFYSEVTKKVEVYIHENSRSNVENLSDKAQRLYLHLLYTIDRDCEWNYINKEFYMKKNGIKSLTTVKNAINELHRYGFIQPAPVKGVYWINPYRFFAGSRIKHFKDNLKVEGNVWDKTKPSNKTTEKKPFKFDKEKQEFEADQTK